MLARISMLFCPALPSTCPYQRWKMDTFNVIYLSTCPCLLDGLVTHDIVTYPYAGSGTTEDPYAVTWIPENDPRNPLNFGGLRKWSLTLLVALCTLTVSFASSTYTGSIAQVEQNFGVGEEVVVTGLSVFVFGFCVGPA